MKVRYEAAWWKNGCINSMWFDDQREAFNMAKEYAKTTFAALRRLTWIDGKLTTEQVVVKADGTWER